MTPEGIDGIRPGKSDEMAEKDTERLFINVTRGLAIFLMLWGHCVQFCSTGEIDFFEDPVFRVIYTFHMPLFMLISGYLFSRSLDKWDFRTLIVRRTQSMLQPIIMIEFLAYYLTTGVWACLNGSFAALFDAKWVANIGSARLWFLWSVLSASLVSAVTFRLIRSKVLRGVAVVLGIGIVALFPNAQMNAFMYPFFIAGLLWGRWKAHVPKGVRVLRFASLVLFPLMLPFYRREHYIYTTELLGYGDWSRQIPIDLFRWAIGFVGSLFVLVVLEGLFALLKTLHKDCLWNICRVAAKPGEKSLQIYTLSVIFLSAYLPALCRRAVMWAGQNFWIADIRLYDFVYTPVLAACYVAALLALNRLLEKWNIGKIIFGR